MQIFNINGPQDILDLLNNTTIKPIVDWKSVKKDDRVLLIIPKSHLLYDNISNNYVLNEIRKTIINTINVKPKYVVIYIDSNNIKFNNELIHNLENTYGNEILWINDLSLLENNDFIEHHNYKKLYLYNKAIENIPLNNYFNNIIIDNIKPVINFDNFENIQDSIVNGYVLAEDNITIRMYMKKILNIRLNSLRSSKNKATNTYNLCYIIGNIDMYNQQDIIDLLKKTYEYRMCSLLYMCNTDSSFIKDVINIDVSKRLLGSFPKIFHYTNKIDIDIGTELISRLERVSKLKANYVFIGDFEFYKKDIKEKWIEWLPGIGDNSIFDPYAYQSLVLDNTDKYQSSFRISSQIINVLHEYIDLENSNDELYSYSVKENEIENKLDEELDRYFNEEEEEYEEEDEDDDEDEEEDEEEEDEEEEEEEDDEEEDDEYDY